MKEINQEERNRRFVGSLRRKCGFDVAEKKFML